jgi:hypothetical protein
MGISTKYPFLAKLSEIVPFFAFRSKITRCQNPTGRNHPSLGWPTSLPAHLSACSRRTRSSVAPGDAGYYGQHPGHPRCVPGCFESKEILHIDAEMHRSIGQRPEPKTFHPSYPCRLTKLFTTSSTALNLNGLRKNAA